MSKFGINSTVYAYHGPLIYKAKILKMHEKEKSFVEDSEGKHESLEEAGLPEALMALDSYFLHYQGWKSKWDEWVTEERMLEFTEENKKVKQELDEMTRRNRAAAKRPVSSRSSATPTATTSVNTVSNGGGNKRNAPEKAATKRRKESKPEINIPFPPEFKYLLVDDWEFITRNKQLVDVPCKKPVSQILKDYYAYKKNTTTDKAVLNEILQGLELYFNKSLGMLLLYKFERLQYMNMIKKGVTQQKKSSEIYGLEHLLRLFVSLPGLIGQTSMDPVSIGVLVHQVIQIMDFLKQNLHKYANDYINTTPAYDGLARS